MQKKLIALAVAGMASTAAFAQSNVTIYGLLQPSYDSVSLTNGATRQNVMSDNNSRIGFRGEEALGNGLKAIFQIESGLNMAEARASSQGGVLGGRDSWLGLAGGFGSVTFGRHQSAYVRSTNTNGFDPFQDSLGDYNNIMGVGTNNVDLNTRWSQSVYYTSPKFNGFEVTASYAMANTDTTVISKDQNTTSLAAVYNNGGLGLLAGYEKQGIASTGAGAGGTGNPGVTAAAGAGDINAWKIGAKYTFATKTTIRGVYENTKSNNFFATGADFDRDSYALSVTHPITSTIDLSAAYMKADKSDARAASANNGASNWTIGADYKLSKRTSTQFMYSSLNNKAGGTYAFDSNGLGGAAGQDAKGFSVRMRHAF